MKNKKIYFIIPIYNEEKIIQKVINELIIKTKSFNRKIILINDGSKDNTISKLKKYKHNKNIKIINKKNEGHGKTVIRGYKFAIKNKCDYVFQLDSDDQFFTSEIKKLIKPKYKQKLIIGKRYNRKDQFLRIVITKIMKMVVFFSHGVMIKDANSPFRLIESNFLKTNLRKIEKSIIPNILISIIACKNKKIKFVNVKHKERETGEVSIKKFKLLIFCIKSLKEIIFF